MKMSELGMEDLLVKLVFEITEEGQLIVIVDGKSNAVLAGLNTLTQRVAHEIGIECSELLQVMAEAHEKSELEKDTPEMQQVVARGLKVLDDAKKKK